MNLCVCGMPAKELAYTNNVYVNEKTYAALRVLNVNAGSSAHEDVYISINGGFVYKADVTTGLNDNQLALSTPQRTFCRVELKEYPITLFQVLPQLAIASSIITVDPLTTSKTDRLEIEVDECVTKLTNLLDGQILRIGQRVLYKYGGKGGRQVKFTVESFVGGMRT